MRKRRWEREVVVEMRMGGMGIECACWGVGCVVLLLLATGCLSAYGLRVPVCVHEAVTLCYVWLIDDTA